MERGIRKILSFVKRQIAANIFGKIILKPCNFEKTQVSRMTEQIQVLYRRWECTLDSLKSVSSVLRRKSSLGATDECTQNVRFCQTVPTSWELVPILTTPWTPKKTLLHFRLYRPPQTPSPCLYLHSQRNSSSFRTGLGQGCRCCQSQNSWSN